MTTSGPIRILVWPLIAAVFLLMLVIPAWAEKDEMELDQFERDIGEQVHEQILRQYGGIYYPRYSEQLLLDEIFSRLEAVTERADIAYSLTLLQSPIVNAFAVPGGYIYLTRGLLQHMRMDPQALAAIIGHEMAHVEQRHGVTSLARQLGLTVLVELGLILFDMQNSEAVRTAGAALIEMAQAGYSRAAELEADRIGLELAVKAGFDPMGAVYAMDHLAAMPRDTLPLAWFRSHPDTAARQQHLIEAAVEYWPAPRPVVDKELPPKRDDPWNRYEVRVIDGSLNVFDLQREETAQWLQAFASVEAVAWHPEGLYLAAAGRDENDQSRIVYIDRWGAVTLWRQWSNMEQVTALTWDCSGQRLAYSLDYGDGMNSIGLGYLYGKTDAFSASPGPVTTLAWDATGVIWDTAQGDRYFWEMEPIETIIVSRPVPPVISPYRMSQGEVIREGEEENLILRIRRPSLQLP